MKTTFGRLLLSQTVSRFSNAALCFVLLVCLLQQTGSAALYGSVTALATVPMLLGVLFGGALADRCRRQRLLSGLDIAAAFGMLMAAAFGQFSPHTAVCIAPIVYSVCSGRSCTADGAGLHPFAASWSRAAKGKCHLSILHRPCRDTGHTSG